MSALSLHGFTQTPAQWARVLESANAPWLPGHGFDPDLSARSWDDAVAAVLTQAKALPAPRRLFGYSMGARLALGALAQEPGLFDRAVLIGVQPGLAGHAEREARRTWEEELAQLLEREGLEGFLEKWERLPLFADQKAGEFSERQAAERRTHRAEGLAHALRVLGLATMPNLWDALPTIECPVELVVGARDTKFLEVGQQMLPLLPSARLHVLADSGHNPFIDAPEPVSVLLRELARPPSLPNSPSAPTPIGDRMSPR